MEGSNTLSSSGVTVVGSDAPSDYHVAPRTTAENPTGSAPPAASVTPPPATVAPTPAAGGAAGVGATTSLKKKRGRPRKYGPDGSVAGALSPKPISSSAPPPVIDFSAVAKRGKVRSITSAAKVQLPGMETESLGEWVSCSVGANFTPHIITVNAGEDVTMKVISFSQQGPRAICILSANGVISSVTLRQPDSSGGTLTYEGRFEILSLTGSFMPSETGGMRNRSGGMSVSLASPDGRVVGGGVAGLLVAASPVQIVVGSFLAGNQLEQKTKKQKPESLSIIPAAAIPISSSGMEDAYHTSPSFRGDSWSSMPQESRNKPTDINVTLPG
ncbi:AT-hook motif nuclear-localized protein 1 [Perilla frutescens var. hirtella]|uniref:AT-hook motif nuclear-localized protein n=1 Tax=Perilla frutescens var. hirtella TaxID=608512 RepID=A0AAD4P9K6_PERFH|nr:AT-hook motif nuclear-localized protein 1 [Perilla frutescens var. frutescens]KAH6777485.1 AT-hook motif nuclear-localized protein 1 [Perilla frutescens var. frutescens]KAH6787504.1 AT-hook motif nuclear-localized protein 1 [Perilla frutescens var. hirtella]KAH6832044.1 AT-hook motif nuclear-localized protein 1 [Perilla frutescens var. hirtella]